MAGSEAEPFKWIYARIGAPCSVRFTQSPEVYHMGGAVSHLLWILYFNAAPGRLRAARLARGLPLDDFTDATYADYVATLVVAGTIGGLVGRARQTTLFLKEVLRTIGLGNDELKKKNAMLSPDVLLRNNIPGNDGAADADQTASEFDPWRRSLKHSGPDFGGASRSD